MNSEIIKKTAHYLQEEIIQQSDRQIDPDEPLISSGLIDSFSLVDVALFIEDTFNVVLENTELDGRTFDTLTELSDLIQKRQL